VNKENFVEHIESAKYQTWCYGADGIYVVCIGVRVRAMVLNVTFNNISDISWRSVLLMKEPGVSAEIHRPSVSHW